MNKSLLFERVVLAIVVLLCSTISLLAAGDGHITVRGIVLDDSSEPLVGAAVLVKGTSFGTTTDIDGKFELSGVTEDAELVFSFMGQDTRTMKASSAFMTVVLSRSAESLDEVVAIGYASVHKEELSSSVSKISSESFSHGVTNSPINLLSGKVAGLSIKNTAGSDPNASPEIQLRGIGTISASNTPLIIIDGVFSSTNDLNSLNPSDIASFNILKDASSTAIYGTRGSNGVIIVETKTAAPGKSTVEYNSYYYTEAPTRQLEVMNSEEYLSYLESKGQSVVNNDYGFSTDWASKLIRHNFGMYQGVAFSTNSANTDLRVNIGYKMNDGMVINTGNNQLNARVNFRQKFFGGKLVADGVLGASSTKARYTDYGAFMQAIVYHPTAPVYNRDGSFFEFPGVGAYNPVALLEQTDNRGKTNLLSGNIGLTWNIVAGLKAHVNMSTSMEDYEGSKYVDRDARDCVQNNYEGYAEMSQHFYRSNTLETYLSYSGTFGDHKVGAMAGYSYNDERRVWSSSSNRGFLTDQMGPNNIGNGEWLGEGKATMGRGEDESRLVAFFGRLNYIYKQRYILNAAFRREGSTRFGENNKWGWFPSVSAAWRIDEESFMKNAESVSTLKLRAGFGISGNQSIPLNMSTAKYNDLGYVFSNGTWNKAYGPVNNPNPNLHWEKNSEYNVGLDFGVLNDRLTVAVDVYYRKTTDLLDWYDAQVPSSIYSSIFTNVGSLSNAGIELSAGADAISMKNFVWHLDGCFSWNENRLLSLSNDTYKANHILYNQLVSPANGQTTYILEAGKPIGTYYGYKYRGFDENGKWIFEDVDKNGKYSPEDFQYLGSGLPKFNYSLTSKFRIFDFDLSFSLRGAAGFKILNVKRIYYENSCALPFNLLRSAIGSPLNDSATFSDYYLENGAFLKMDNLTLGYNFTSGKLRHPLGMRVYTTVTNVFTATGYSGVNPEAGSGLTPGLDGAGYYPNSRSFIFGLNLKF